MAVIERKYDCPRCWGTGSIESSDSGDESWWDCSTCKGTGKLADRRRPDPQLRGAVEALREVERICAVAGGERSGSPVVAQIVKAARAGLGGR